MTVGIDTNVLLRLIINDDEEQRAAALAFGKTLSEAEPAFVTIVALVECDWALRTTYGYDRARRTDAIATLIRLRHVTVEGHNVILQALSDARKRNADFADAIIARLSAANGCDHVVTFDKPAAKRLPTMTLLA